MRFIVQGLAILALLAPAFEGAAGATERVGIWEWEGVSRVVSIGDVHGGHDKLLSLLQSADLIDEELTWIGGESHLVVTGDFLDRGAVERPIVSLLRRLQGESELAGGHVHVLLGNHESLNLLRDLRYVNPASYADFADHETKKQRKAAWKRYAANDREGARPAYLRERFNETYPFGYFGRLEMLDGDGEIGSWLLELPAVVRLDGVVYLHGGLTEEFAGLGIDGINRKLLGELRRHVESRRILEQAGLVSPTMSFREIVGTARRSLVAESDDPLSTDVQKAAGDLVESAMSPILRGGGPLWYRGNSYEDERLERDMLQRSLEMVGAEAMVVAHSFTGGNMITSRFHGQLYRLDHGILESSSPLALVVEKGEVMVLDSTSQELSRPIPELPTGQKLQDDTSPVAAGAREKFLARAAMTGMREIGRGTTRPSIVVLEQDGQIHRGIFKAIDEGAPEAGEDSADRYQHELAAYLVDRRLGLDMVPVTVIREFDGRRGSLQWWVQGAVDREAAEAYDLELYHSEEAAASLRQGEIFDALIGNRHRSPDDILRRVNGGEVFLIDHSKAFSTSSELVWQAATGAPVPARLAAALEALDRAELAAELDSLLSSRQIDALFERRDRILERVELATR